jgi:hypothetical protein
MKIKYSALLAASLLMPIVAFAAKERCGPQRPNSQFYHSIAPSRIIVGSATQTPIPTTANSPRSARASVFNEFYRPGGGINCERTAIFTGAGFSSVGYYEYLMMAPLNSVYSGIKIEFKIPAHSGNLVDNIPIKFTEYVFNDGRSLSLYMMSIEAKESTASVKRNVVVFGDFGDFGYSDDSITRRQMLAVTTLPFYTDSWAGDRDYEIKLNWTQKRLTLSTYAYSTFLDPNAAVNTPFFLASSEIELTTPLQTLSSVRIGSVEKTTAFIDGPNLQWVLSVDSVRWITAAQ